MVIPIWGRILAIIAGIILFIAGILGLVKSHEENYYDYPEYETYRDYDDDYDYDDWYEIEDFEDAYEIGEPSTDAYNWFINY